MHHKRYRSKYQQITAWYLKQPQSEHVLDGRKEPSAIAMRPPRSFVLELTADFMPTTIQHAAGKSVVQLMRRVFCGYWQYAHAAVMTVTDEPFAGGPRRQRLVSVATESSNFERFGKPR